MARGLIFNAATHTLYVTESQLNGVVSVCDVNSDGRIAPGACAPYSNGFVYPTGVSIN